MRRLLLLIFVLPACGNQIVTQGVCLRESNWFQAGGLNICSEVLGGVSGEEVETLIEIVETETKQYYPGVDNLPKKFKDKGIDVLFIDDHLAQDCEEIELGIYRCENTLGGATIDDGSVRIYLVYRECLAYSALDHEVLHLIEKLYLGGSPGDHSTPSLFIETTEPSRDAVEYMVFNEAIDTLESCQ